MNEDDAQYDELNEIEKEELDKKEKDEQLSKAYYSTFHSPEGQIVLNDLLNRYYRRTSLTEPCDPNTVLVSEGSRYVVLQILARMELIGGKQED
jgi:hypothetical protein